MKLLERGRIGSLEIKNRVIMSAMGIRGLCETDGDWGERVRAYYQARAAGGVGLIITEMIFVTQALEPVATQCFNPASSRHLASLRLLADALHACDCKLGVQLTAGFGRVLPAPVAEEGVPPVSASINSNHYVPDYPDLDTRALTTEEVAALALAFGSAALSCRKAGADCVELHGHEGYILDQFMTALWNRRDDRYGGSREKRLTLAREAVGAIHQEAGDDFPIIYRYGLTHYLEEGRQEEEGLWIARELEQMGVDALHVDAGCYETHWWPHPPAQQPPGCMVDLAEKVKHVVSLPVISVGRLHYPEVAINVVEQGKADFIALGRGLLAESDWVNKVKDNRTEEIMPCLGCHVGCLWEMILGEPTSCALNPVTGHEIEWSLNPLKEKRSLLVVGGGPAGIEAARVGARRGFDVTLWEATDRLGGNLWPGSVPDFKHDIVQYLKYLKLLVRRLPLHVELNKRATAEEIVAFGADYVVLATGAAMAPPPFDKVPSGKLLSALEVLNGQAPQGERILVMGGGLIGCETAVYLARRGKQIMISTRREVDDLADNITDRSNREMLLHMIEAADIKLFPLTVPIRLESDGVIVDQNGVEKKIGVDSIVFAGPLQPRNALAKALENMRDTVFSAGDCVASGEIRDAVWGGFHAVRTIEE